MLVSQQFASLDAGEQAVFNLITSTATDQEICRKLKYESEDLPNVVAHINAVFSSNSTKALGSSRTCRIHLPIMSRLVLED